MVWDSGEGALRERRSGGAALGEKVFGGGGGKCKVSVRGGLWCFGGRFWVKKAGRIGQKRAESGRIGQKRAETGRNGSRNQSPQMGHRWPEIQSGGGTVFGFQRARWRDFAPPPGRWTASRLPRGIIP